MGRKMVNTVCALWKVGCAALVRVENGKAVKIEADPESPVCGSGRRICAKGLASLEMLYHPDRLKYPLKREMKTGVGGVPF